MEKEILDVIANTLFRVDLCPRKELRSGKYIPIHHIIATVPLQTAD